MRITYYGHACLGIEVDGFFIVVDPFISGNPKAHHISINEIKADYILLTHAHGDHVLDVETIMTNNPDAMLVSNAEIADYYSKKGYQTHPMNHGGSWQFEFGKLKYTNAVHSSSFPDGVYGGQAGGFVVESKNKNVYIAGDTALTYDFKLIPLTIKLDLAVLPIGNNFTMGVDDALIASNFLECDKIMGYHYDTFGYIEINHEEAVRKFYEKDKDLMLLEIGESIEL